MFKEMPKVGQIYRTKHNELFVVTNIIDSWGAYIIYANGTTDMYKFDGMLEEKLIAQANTWQEAIQSEYFRDE